MVLQATRGRCPHFGTKIVPNWYMCVHMLGHHFGTEVKCYQKAEEISLCCRVVRTHRCLSLGSRVAGEAERCESKTR